MILANTYPLQLQRRFPFYGWVPKEWRANLAFREAVLRAGDDTPEYRADLWEMCRRDFLFWLNTFAFVEEPRGLPGYRTLPFITRSIQDAAAADLLDCIPLEDCVLHKSREVGASWLAMAKAGHDFLFLPGTKIGVVSAIEELVDKTGDSSTLFAKLDFLLSEDRFPWWLLPHQERNADGLLYKRNFKLFENKENGSAINGYACKDDVGRGGRKAWWLIDELASFPPGSDQAAMDALVGNTNCRVMISTPKLPAGVYYNAIRFADQTRVRVINMDWKDDPEKRAGLYTSENGKLKAIDRDFWAQVFKCKLEDVERVAEERGAAYPFKLDGETRSPYFDWMLTRPGVNAKTVARELNRRFEGAGGAFFTLGLWERLANDPEKGARPPLARGRFAVDPEDLSVRWMAGDDGPVKLWTPLNHEGKPPIGRQYAFGADVAAGTAGEYSSNSAAVILDAVTGEQVLGFSANDIKPEAFATWSVAVCKLFNNAHMNWDANGGGGKTFGNRVLELGYGNITRHSTEMVGAKQVTRKPGTHIQGTGAKEAFLASLESAIDDGTITLKDSAIYEEASQYVWKNGKIVHSTSVSTDDESAMGDAHGDRVIAAAMALKCMKDRPAKEPTPETGPAPYGSLAWRIQENERRLVAARSEFDWD